jgi:hypothetical protein
MRHGVTHVSDRVTAECEVYQDVSKQQNIIQLVQRYQCASTRIIARRRDVPRKGTCRPLLAENIFR